MQARINKIALVGWRGIRYLELELDQGPFTGLVGGSGAGKSTIAMCVCFALLPDHAVLDMRPISDVEDSHLAGVDTLAARLDPLVGFGYVVLDITAADGNRVIAGIHVHAIDGRAEFTRFNLEAPQAAIPLQDFLRVIEGEDEVYPDFVALRMALAVRGLTLRECRTVREYGEVLYNAGILPCDLSDRADRALFARLVESAFKGGLSRDVATRLKEYMLPAATRVPDSVDRLQKCADTVLRTQSALGEAERQLKILESTFGLGKGLVTRAIREVKCRITDAQAREKKADEEVSRHQATLTSLDITDPQIANSIDIARDAKKSIEDGFNAAIEQHQQDQKRCNADQLLRGNDLREKKERLQQFETGRKAWRGAAGDDWETHDEAFVRLQLHAREEELHTQKARLQIEREEKTLRRNKLAAGVGESSSALLGDALGAKTLAEEFDQVDVGEALALEMALGGVVDGVVGVDLDALVSLPDNDDFPHTFWLRSSLPEAKSVHQVGAWSATPLAGGFLVASARRQLSLGSHARDTERRAINARLEDITREWKQIADRLDQLGKRKETLLGNTESIALYFAHRNKEALLHKAVADAEEASDAASRQLQRVQDSLSQLLKDRQSKTATIDSQIRSLEEQQAKAKGARANANAGLKEQHVAYEQAFEQRAGAMMELESIQVALDTSFAWLDAESDGLGNLHRDVYISTQSTAITKLGHALAEESPESIVWLNSVVPHDPVSCCAIWRPLRGIVSDRISVDTLDQEGADLIGTMVERRSTLATDLENNRSEMRAEAKSLYSVIATEIRKQEQRIKRLSGLGETLQFGNVTGMRIRPSQRTDLLEHLQSVTQQVDMFVRQPDKPLELQLAELFQKALSIKLDGSALLDYRTYMELSIEACRNGEWKSAAGLSGGESIGGGLAVALMLSRSLSQRSADVRPRVYTPFFVIDEVQRLNRAGQAVIVEFGKQQGLQILVTAISLEATYECTLHVLDRIFSPEETIVSRQVHIVPEVASGLH